ncbi:YbdD/YjiX family protein [Paraburkholderia strydomiana]|uniref:YbdD/YjiX family protein n=1 Tax=Paraburkholderia strydomiana TaxID=1245417 RepID=UPI00286D3329|nr:YbdD/YjiX family protein [Paraburkholderia strydomiana]
MSISASVRGLGICICSLRAAISPCSRSSSPGTRLSELVRTIRGACAQMFGIPDYERYIEHMASRHPCDPPLSRREFFIWSIDRKYCRNGPRCC